MNTANKITILRMILVPLLAGCLLYWKAEDESLRYAAAAIFSLACFTDAADGFIARRMRQITHLGSLIDPLADKALLLTAYFSLAFLNNIPSDFRLPVWLSLVVISRDVLILAGVAVIYALHDEFKPQTNFLGKTTTFVQMILILFILWGLYTPFVPHLIVLTTVLTLLSGISYMRIGTNILSASGTSQP